MLSNDQPLGGAGFKAVGAVGLIDPANDPLTLDANPPANSSSVHLSELVDPAKPRPSVDDVLRWADQILDNIHQLHTQPRPIIHGGIAPSAVRLDGNTARLLPLTDVPDASAEQNVSYRSLEQMWESLDNVTQRVILNPLDERAQNSLLKEPGPASDIYSVGATMYAVATGIVPPDALDRTIASMEGKPDPLTHPSEVSNAIPVEIGDAIIKAMSLRREDRPFSAIILRQVLRTATVKIQERLASEPEVAPAPESAPAAASESKVAQQEQADADNARHLAMKILAEKAAVAEKADDILDLSDAGVEAAAPLVEPIAGTEPEEMALPEVAVAKEPEPEPVIAAVETDPEPVVSYQSETPSFLTDTDIDLQPPSSSKGLFIGIAAALLAIAGIGGFLVFSSSKPSTAQPSAATKTGITAPEPQPVAAEPQIQTSTQAELPASETAVTPETTDTAAQRNTRAGVAPSGPDKAKKNTTQPATAAKPAPAKKQVTVDDLINDN